MEGALSPGVLVAAQKVMAKARADPTAPPEMLQSLESVTELLMKTLDALEKLRPKSELAEALTELDPTIPEERAQMQALMKAAFAKDVDQVDFMEDMVYFVQARRRRCYT